MDKVPLVHLAGQVEGNLLLDRVITHTGPESLVKLPEFLMPVLKALASDIVARTFNNFRGMSLFSALLRYSLALT